MPEQTYKIRHRVNFSVSVKGIVTPDVTVEIYDGTQDAVLKEATDLLTKAMEEAHSRTPGVFQVK